MVSPNKGSPMRKFYSLILGAPLVAASSVFFAHSADAHTVSIQGTPECTASTGTYKVEWTGQTANVPKNVTETITTTAHSPASSTVPGTIATKRKGNASYSFEQTNIPGSTTYASVTVHATWSDGYSDNATGTVHLPGDCGGSTPSPTPSATPTDIPSPPPVPSPSVTPLPSITPSPSPSGSPSPSPSVSSSPSPSFTPTPTPTPAPSPSVVAVLVPISPVAITPVLLPFTGSTTIPIGTLGIVLIVAGLLLLFVIYRR